jgi:putative Holliday junction resolvase
MRILALDLGERRIGLAVSDPMEILATGLPTLERKSIEEDLSVLEKIVKERSIGKIILGFPKHMNGDIGEKANESIRFKDLLESRFKVPVELLDERWTTVMAKKILVESNVPWQKGKGKVDQIAAQLILENYLERQKNKQ